MICKARYLAVVLLVFSILFTGCGSYRNSRILCGSAVKFSGEFLTNDEYEFSFTVNILTRSKDDAIVFDSFDGENVDSLTTVLYDNIFGDDEPQRIMGYYIRMLLSSRKSITTFC